MKAIAVLLLVGLSIVSCTESQVIFINIVSSSMLLEM